MDIRWKSKTDNNWNENDSIFGFFLKIIHKGYEHRMLLLGIPLIFLITDIVLLKWVIPYFRDTFRHSVYIWIFIFLASILWTIFLLRYIRAQGNDLDVLDYPNNFLRWKRLWRRALPPLVLYELCLWVMLLSPERPYDVVIYYSNLYQDTGHRVFEELGGSYLNALCDYRNLWVVFPAALWPAILWLFCLHHVRLAYAAPLFQKIRTYYEGLCPVYSDEILRPFFYGTETPDSLTKEWREQKQLMQQAIEDAANERLRSERLKMELITNVSHDLKTPLTAIFNNLELMRRETSLDEMKQYAADIRILCEKLRLMIERLFSLSKANSKNEPLQLQTIEMNCLIRQTLSDMDEILEHAPAVFRTQLEETPLPFLADSRYAYSICQNLLENASKYSLAGSRVYVRTRETAEKNVCLEIVNTSAYEMDFSEEYVTERFVRGDSSRTTEGNGLGLAIVKAYTEACGGTFRIQIDGDQFKASVTFPRAEPEPSKSDCCPIG